MKKLTAILISALLVLALCACDAVDGVELPPLPTVTEDAESTESAAPEESAGPEATEEPAEAEPERSGENAHVIVSVSRTELAEYDPQNGTKLILEFAYDVPTVYIDGGDEAAALINEAGAVLAEAYYTGESYGDGYGTGYMNLLTLAEDDYNYKVNEGIEDEVYYSASRSVSVARADGAVLTLVYDDYTYTGGAHGSYGTRAYCYDTETGERLSLSDLTEDYDALSKFLVDYMVQQTQSDEELMQRIDLLEDGVSYTSAFIALLRDGSWYLGADGLTIFSDLYEISSYAAGPISFTVPYSELGDYIDAKWLPESAEGEAEFTAVASESMEDGSTVIVDKLTVSDGGAELYLVSSGAARDVKINAVEYSTVFYDKGLLWYCSLMDSSALQLVTDIPDGMPNLKLSWTDADGGHSVYLSQSGEDGSLLLIAEDKIEAVG